MTKVVLLGGLVLLACLVAFALRRRAGDAREVDPGERISAAELGAELGAAATFVQFSSETCTTCRAARRVLGGVAAAEDGVAHVELDAAERLDLARRHRVLRTPTVLVLDPAGRVTHRISGAPTPAQARAALTTSEVHR